MTRLMSYTDKDRLSIFTNLLKFEASVVRCQVAVYLGVEAILEPLSLFERSIHLGKHVECLRSI
ncbi:protein of unknown function [Methylorubrum extorquens]|uniref:Uncharacterized protein n=1 Tax=Methylorubrum extorquens TaxID=408 RepID=A0A2N9AM78_METEX|nr:protein of unknown function [Methylorubrum extorquens]